MSYTGVIPYTGFMSYTGVMPYKFALYINYKERKRRRIYKNYTTAYEYVRTVLRYGAPPAGVGRRRPPLCIVIRHIYLPYIFAL